MHETSKDQIKKNQIKELMPQINGDLWAAVIATRTNEPELVKELIDDMGIAKAFGGYEVQPDRRNILEQLIDAFLSLIGIDNKRYGVNGVNMEGATPLHLVAGSKDLVALLVEKYKADLNIPDRSGATPIFNAVSLGVQPDIVKYMKEHGADLAHRDNEGNSLLHCAIKEHRDTTRDLTKTILYLIEQGLNPNDKNAAGESVYDLASRLEKPELRKLMETAYRQQEARGVAKSAMKQATMAESLAQTGLVDEKEAMQAHMAAKGAVKKAAEEELKGKPIPSKADSVLGISASFRSKVENDKTRPAGKGH